jgi:alpha-L-arabinofuranosidase
MASYAPLFAKKNHTQWKPDMIFFDNKQLYLTPNYYVQKMFAANHGDLYFKDVVELNRADSTVAASCVRDSKTGDMILKLANVGNTTKVMKIDISAFKGMAPAAQQTILTGSPDVENSFDNAHPLSPVESTVKIGSTFEYNAPANSFTVIRIKPRK